jgi:hypothetical protein
MVDARVPIIVFNQYGTSSAEDRLYLLAAPAKLLAQWAGVPRKGWRIRMLYQRWITPARAKELASFWDRAAQPNVHVGESYILGPTAITLAIQEDVEVSDGCLHMHYDSPH